MTITKTKFITGWKLGPSNTHIRKERHLIQKTIFIFSLTVCRKKNWRAILGTFCAHDLSFLVETPSSDVKLQSFHTKLIFLFADYFLLHNRIKIIYGNWMTMRWKKERRRGSFIIERINYSLLENFLFIQSYSAKFWD